MKTVRSIPRLLFACIVLFVPRSPAMAVPPAGTPSALFLQESGAGAPLGKLNVSAEVMAGHCLTMVSPTYPRLTDDSPKATSVIVRVVIWKSGIVSPAASHLRTVSAAG